MAHGAGICTPTRKPDKNHPVMYYSIHGAYLDGQNRINNSWTPGLEACHHDSSDSSRNPGAFRGADEPEAPFHHGKIGVLTIQVGVIEP